MIDSINNFTMLSQSALPSHCGTTRQVAQQLGVSIGTIQNWVDAGLLRAWRTAGGHRRISWESVDFLIRDRTRTALTDKRSANTLIDACPPLNGLPRLRRVVDPAAVCLGVYFSLHSVEATPEDSGIPLAAADLQSYLTASCIHQLLTEDQRLFIEITHDVAHHQPEQFLLPERCVLILTEGAVEFGSEPADLAHLTNQGFRIALRSRYPWPIPPEKLQYVDFVISEAADGQLLFSSPEKNSKAVEKNDRGQGHPGKFYRLGPLHPDPYTDMRPVTAVMQNQALAALCQLAAEPARLLDLVRMLDKTPDLKQVVLALGQQLTVTRHAEQCSLETLARLAGSCELRRWLILSLYCADQNIAANPVVWAALRRAYMVHHLLWQTGQAALLEQGYLAGLLAPIAHFPKLQQADLPLAEHIQQAYTDPANPLWPILQSVIAYEDDDFPRLLELSRRLKIRPAQYFEAHLKAMGDLKATSR